jgi:PAS domain S-box-containing protein
LLINRDVGKKAEELGAQRIGQHAVSYLGVPILAGGEAIGVISVQSTHQEDVFNEDDLRLLSTIAANAGAAIQTARLHAEAQRRAQEMSALTEVGRELSASLDSAVVMDKVSARAKRLLAAETSAVFLMKPDQKSMHVATAIGKHADGLRADTIRVGEGIIGRLAQDGRSEIVNDTSEDARGVKIPGTTDEASVEHLMATPLLRGAQVVGMMAVWRSSEPFTETDLNFLSGLARQASIALENARLFTEIRAEKKFSEALVNNSPVAIVSIDEAASVVAWNPGAERLFGYAASEAIGRNIDSLVANHPDLVEEALGYTAAEKRGEQIRAITKRTRKDGMLVDVELAGVPVAVDNERVGWIGIFHDITELQHAREQAVAANEAKSAFLATMSHEIRTPMNAVIGMSGLLMDTTLSKEQREYAETIRNSGDALLAIINDILDFSKIEAGKMDLESQPFDLRECVESALDLVAGRAVEKNVDLAYIIDDDVPAGIKGDVTRLRQILLNLLSNAVKFTEAGEVVLTVKRDLGLHTLRFAVRDTGIGIPADRMSRLFESFSQADSSTTRRFGGTGLGLAISKRLSEMMGGGMWADSGGAGRGATFWFTIKFAEAEVSPRKTVRDIKGLQPALEGKRVLIVDDNATNRRILTLQTQKWGMKPRESSSPREALELLKGSEAFDLAILDMQMPEMDGVMLTRELRQLKTRRNLPIILLTSLGRNEAVTLDLQFAAYLTKPLKPSALFDALAGIFARKLVTPAAEPARMALDPTLARRHPLRILLAEDNAVNQKLALRLLEQMGYRADIASNGMEAVESVQRQNYDVVLMDVQMPELDGLDATRSIRKLKGIPPPRIVAMTANAMQGDRELCIAAGMDDYISKPIRVQELHQALLSSTGGTASPRARARRTPSVVVDSRPPANRRKKAATRSNARGGVAVKAKKR